jgi:two-component system chemotaxis sensor kinase CheA
MSGQYFNEPMLEMYIFETTQNIEQLEMLILETEKSNGYTQDTINEIFRIMHTIKGSSAMMLFNNISGLAHSIEDLFYFLREQKPHSIDCSTLSDLLLEGVDYIKVELQKIKDGNRDDGDTSILIENIKGLLTLLKQQNPLESVVKNPTSNKQAHFYISPDIVNPDFNHNSFKATILFDCI